MKLNTATTRQNLGAGDGNRTRMASLEGWMGSIACVDKDTGQKPILVTRSSGLRLLGTLRALTQTSSDLLKSALSLNVSRERQIPVGVDSSYQF